MHHMSEMVDHCHSHNDVGGHLMWREHGAMMLLAAQWRLSVASATDTMKGKQPGLATCSTPPPQRLHLVQPQSESLRHAVWALLAGMGMVVARLLA